MRRLNCLARLAGGIAGERLQLQRLFVQGGFLYLPPSLQEEFLLIENQLTSLARRSTPTPKGAAASAARRDAEA